MTTLLDHCTGEGVGAGAVRVVKYHVRTGAHNAGRAGSPRQPAALSVD
jgi:hypothetical protein